MLAPAKFLWDIRSVITDLRLFDGPAINSPEIYSKKVLVISGVGMAEGGILSILQDVVKAASATLSDEWRVIALVHKKCMFADSRVEFLEFPEIKKSWFKRVCFELVTSNRLSRSLRADVWLSMHDMTSITSAPRQFVYAHNPSSFVRPGFKDFYFDPKFFFHSCVYRFVYGLNIKRNTNVFVQQSWIKDIFEFRYGLRNVLVASPKVAEIYTTSEKNGWDGIRPIRLIYPTFARHFKNIEVICEALFILQERGNNSFQVSITIEGNENRYAKWLYRRFGHVKGVSFIGLQKREDLFSIYRSSDGLVFPSFLETWGLPLSEAQEFELPILAADLPYARETIGDYEKVSFFNPRNAHELADLLQKMWDKPYAEFNLSRPFLLKGTKVDIVNWEDFIKHTTEEL
jgi:glycosyltransferase involved in cell wall biosynthesis